MERSEDRILHLVEEYKIGQTLLKERKRSSSMILIVMSRINKIMITREVSTAAISTMTSTSRQKAPAKLGLKDRVALILLTKCFTRTKIANNLQAARNNWRLIKRLIGKNLKFLNK